MSLVDGLNKQHGFAGELLFEAGPGGLPVARITNDYGDATIALQGAQVLTWQPQDEAPVIWLSTDAKFARGKSVRGGVPVCWPWFGAHATDASYPAHGFARTTGWSVLASEQMSDGGTRVAFRLDPTDATRAQWPHRTPVQVVITVGAALTVELITRNDSNKPVTIGEALHTYFHVSNIEDVSVTGLEDKAYLDKVRDMARDRQAGPVRFDGETDRIYLDTGDICAIEDPGLGRRIRISSRGARATVVWTPWRDKAAKMGDLGEDGWKRMLCVETANAAEHVVTIAPGTEHSMTASYSVEPL